MKPAKPTQKIKAMKRPYHEILAETMPEEMRGKFLAHTQRKLDASTERGRKTRQAEIELSLEKKR